MKKILKMLSLLGLIILMLASCSPDDYSLGKVDVKPEDLVEGIAFKIEHDAANPNIVYLTSLMGNGYTPLWNHPQGRSQKQSVTLKIAFPGTYNVQFGVETPGGIVYGDTVTFQIDNMYTGFIEDELWTLLTGGVGQEKTWYLDLDAGGVSRYFAGPLFFYGVDDSWASVTEGQSIDGDSWNYTPDWAGNTWLMNAADFGTMTFDLKNGANVTVVHNTLSSRGTETGTFSMSTEDHTMKMTDASPLHDSNRDGVVVDWGNIKILSLTENTMQLGVLRDAALSGESACLLVYNYISKDYKDNWVAGEEEPPYDGNANDDLTTTSTKVWNMSTKTPYNWANLDGSLIYNWTSPADYIATGWASYNQSMIEKVVLKMTRTETSAGTYVFTDATGSEISGSYIIDDKNNIDFGKAISFAISGSVTFSTTSDNELRLINTDVDALGDVSGIWLGKRDPAKAEYMVYHFELATTSTADPLAAWESALVGKTFKPDVNWFVDWVGFPTSFSGGWTSSSTFGSDYVSNSWVWDADVRAIAESARLSFSESGGSIKVTLNQTKNGVVYTATGTVDIDTDNNILNIDIPLVDYSGTVASWLSPTNTKSITGDVNDWYFVSHGGSTLSNISTNGFWLGYISNSITTGGGR